MKTGTNLFKIAVIAIIFLCSLFFLKDFNLTWVQVFDNRAIVTINFLFPMDQDKFASTITLSGGLPDAQDFSCMLAWKSDTTVQLQINELSAIKGQKIKLNITNASSQIPWISKNESVDIQFRSKVELIKPSNEVLIATNGSCEIQFNTPMDKKVLNKYLQSDTKFCVDEVEVILDNGNTLIDPTKFIITPKKPLDNDKRYMLSFRRGMPSQSGVMLQEDINITLNTDIKPLITHTYPENENNWIGLYPRIILQTDRPIKSAHLYINNQVIPAKVLKKTRAEFLFGTMLKPSTNYQMWLEVEAPSGEKSIPKEINFTTVPIKEDRIWVEVILSAPQKLIVHQGNETLKTITCSGGLSKTPTLLGTYYITNKEEKFFDSEKNEGANVSITLSEGIKIHGIIRDEYWVPKQKVRDHLGAPQTKGDIVVDEEDATWLYNTLPLETMIIIRE